MAKVRHATTKSKVRLSAPRTKEHRLSPKELGLLADKLANASSPAQAARLKAQITRGLYGV